MTRAAPLLAIALALPACTDNVLVFSPIFDGPVDDADASAFPVTDSIQLSIAHEGDATDLVSALFTQGQPLELAGVPFGERLVLHAQGKRGSTNVSYGRTCPFTLAAGQDPPQPHLFFSRSATFANVDLASVPRTGGRAISYQGGVLLVGGVGETMSVDTPELYDPRTNELVVLPSNIRKRAGAIDALFGTSPPSILILGGSEGLSTPADYVEILDPPDGRTELASGGMGRVGMTASTLADGSVVVIGGNVPGVPTASSTITEITRVDNLPRIRDVATLATARTGHTATVLGDYIGAPVLVAGGTDRVSGAGTTIAAAELYKPLSRTLADPAVFIAQMKFPRTQHKAVRLPDNSVLFLGGLDSNGAPVRALERFTLEEGFVDTGAELAADVGVVDMTVTTLADGSILVAGGRADGDEASPRVQSVARVQLDPLSGIIDALPTVDRLANARAGHQAALLCDGTVLLTGGGPAIAERYNPNAEGRR